jgi:hypothetical protein
MVEFLGHRSKEFTTGCNGTSRQKAVQGRTRDVVNYGPTGRLGLSATYHQRRCPRPLHDWVGNDSKPIYFDGIDNSAYILGKAQHSARLRGIILTASFSREHAPTSAAIPGNLGSISPGNTS